MISHVRTALLLSVLVVGASSDCSTLCYAECAMLATGCETNAGMQVYSGSCSSHTRSCRSTCDDVYCPCVAKVEKACNKDSVTCKNKNGEPNFSDIEKTSDCISCGSNDCFSQVINITSQTAMANAKEPFPYQN